MDHVFKVWVQKANQLNDFLNPFLNLINTNHFGLKFEVNMPVLVYNWVWVRVSNHKYGILNKYIIIIHDT